MDKRLAWFGVALIGYFILVNVVAFALSADSGTNPTDSTTASQGGVQQLGVADTINVQVTRNRWYGTIVESAGEAPISTLYLAGIFSIPLKVGEIDFQLFHIAFISIWAITLLLFITWPASSTTRKEVTT